MKQINLCLINKHFNVPFEGAPAHCRNLKMLDAHEAKSR